MKKAQYLFLMITIFSYSCKNTVKESRPVKSGYTEIDIKPGNKHGSLVDSIIVEKIVSLETIERSIISKDYAIKRVIDYGNKIYVLDRKFMMVKVFNERGRYLYDLGALGTGTAEFTNLQDIAIDYENNIIWLLCNTPNKLVAFSKEGKFLKEVKLSFFASCFGFGKGGNVYFFNNQNPNDVSLKKNLLITNSKFILKSYSFDQPKKLKTSLDFTGNIFNTGNEIFFNPPFERTIFKLQDDKAQAFYNVNFGSQSITDEVSSDSINHYMQKKSSISMFLVNNDKFVGFKYFRKRDPMVAFYDIKTKFLLQTDTTLNVLNTLFTNNIFQSNNEFMILINFDGLSPFINQHKEAVIKRFPALYQAMIKYKKNDNPSIIYFKIK